MDEVFQIGEWADLRFKIKLLVLEITDFPS